MGRTDLASRKSNSERFLRLDRRLYAPLCLALSLGAARPLPGPPSRGDGREKAGGGRRLDSVSIQIATGVGCLDRPRMAGLTQEAAHVVHDRIHAEATHDQGRSQGPHGRVRKRGAETGEIANYVKADGTGGYTITDSEDIASAYEGALAYSQWMSVSVSPILKIDDAVGPIFAYLG